MATIELIHKRVGNDIQMAVQILDNGDPINWSEVTALHALLISDSQRVRLGSCTIDGALPQDATTMMLTYSGKSPQYLGVARLVLSFLYRNHQCALDTPVLCFVSSTSEEGLGPVEVYIPADVDPEINSLQIVIGGGGSASWGTITGDITDQTDLIALFEEKQDVISDLSTIRSGADLGATAVQPGSLATVATSGSYNDLSNKPTIPAAQIQSDWDQSDNTKADYIKNKPTIPSGVVVDQTYDATSANAQSGVAMAGALAGKENTISDLSTIRSGAALGATAVQPGSLATVATSGSYNDLSNKPTIPAAQVNADWNANSGVAQILNKPTIDATPTSASTNAVQSGGVYAALADRYTKAELAAMAETWTFTLDDDSTVTKKIIVLPSV